MTPHLLLSGHDTIECAYYLAPDHDYLLNYERLAAEKEDLRQSKSRNPQAIKLGSEEFMLAGHGTGSGFPFLIENNAFSIQFGEFNQPNFFVTFRSIALWHSSAQGLHKRFMAWAKSLGLRAYQPERISRVDFTFDYHLPEIDFDEDNFVSSFTNKIFAPERLQVMVAELRKRIRSSKDGQQERINELNRQIKQIERKQENLLNAIENGTIELDEATQRRAQQHKAAREALFVELAGVRRDHSLPAVEYVKASQVDVFGKVLREKLLAANSPLAKSYLNILVDEVVVQDKTATIKGSYAALAETMEQIKKWAT